MNEPASRKASEPPESGWDHEDGVLDIPSSAVVIAAEDVRAQPPPLRASSPDPQPGRIGSMHEAPMARRARSSPDLLPELPQSLAPLAPRSIEPTPPAPPTSPRTGEVTPTAPMRPRANTQTEIFGLNNIPLETQEQLFGILKASLDATLTPLLDKQTELEKRLDALRESEERAALATASRLVSPASGPRGGGGGAASSSQAGTSVPPPHVSIAPSVAPSPLRAGVGPGGTSVRPPIVSTSYGLVIEAPRGSMRPPIEAALERVGPIEVPDFGSGRRAAGRVLLALLFAGVIAAIAATILSYT